jgi:hypothetical protein
MKVGKYVEVLPVYELALLWCVDKLQDVGFESCECEEHSLPGCNALDFRESRS